MSGTFSPQSMDCFLRMLSVRKLAARLVESLQLFFEAKALIHRKGEKHHDAFRHALNDIPFAAGEKSL